MTRVCYDTVILDDDRHELTEAFFTNLTSNDPLVNILPSRGAVIVILDDDSKFYQAIEV